jgi:hypothetical protein
VNSRLALALGAVGIAALLGLITRVPVYVGFFVGAIAVLIFPGLALTHLVASRQIGRFSLPGRLAVYFVAGIGILASVGFAGLMLHLTLSRITVVLAGINAFFIILLLVKKLTVDSAPDAAGGRRSLKGWMLAVIFVVAVGASLLTLLTPRDSDDWYYLAHISNYVAGHPLRSEDAIFDQGEPPSPREWYGSWWVVEALLAKVTGTHPVDCHQTYLPILIVTFSVFGVFALATRLFRSPQTALMACCLQILFYMSSVYPYNTVGWMFLCRTAQDKSASCILVVPVTIAIALESLGRARGDVRRVDRGFYILYIIALVTSALIHPLGPVWVALMIIPFFIIEALRQRRRDSIAPIAALLLPFLICAALLAPGRTPMVENLEEKGLRTSGGAEIMTEFSVYLPGDPFPRYSEASYVPALELTPKMWIVNPLYVLRFPMAVAALVLCAVLPRYFKSSSTARFLGIGTLLTLFLAFTPPGTAVVSSLIVAKLAFRLSWILPWGFILAFFLARLRLADPAKWLLILVAVMAIGRGRPSNYVSAHYAIRDSDRPSAADKDVLKALGAEPAPQGYVLAPPGIGRYIAAVVPDAYPIRYRGEGPIKRPLRRELLLQPHLDQEALRELAGARCNYIIVKNTLPLSHALENAGDHFVLLRRNDTFSLWKVLVGAGAHKGTSD